MNDIRIDLPGPKGFRPGAPIPSGRGHILPLPVGTPSPSPEDALFLRQLRGAFEPWVGWAIVNAGMLCFDELGRAQCYYKREAAQAVLDAIGNPQGWELVEVLAVDREAGPRTLG